MEEIDEMVRYGRPHELRFGPRYDDKVALPCGIAKFLYLNRRPLDPVVDAVDDQSLGPCLTEVVESVPADGGQGFDLDCLFDEVLNGSAGRVGRVTPTRKGHVRHRSVQLGFFVPGESLHR